MLRQDGTTINIFPRDAVTRLRSSCVLELRMRDTRAGQPEGGSMAFALEFSSFTPVSASSPMGTGCIGRGHFSSDAGAAPEFTYPLTAYGDLCALIRVHSNGVTRLWLNRGSGIDGSAACPASDNADSLRAASSVVMYTTGTTADNVGTDSLPQRIDFAFATSICSAGFTLVVSGNTISCHGQNSWERLTATEWSRGAYAAGACLQCAPSACASPTN